MFKDVVKIQLLKILRQKAAASVDQMTYFSSQMLRRPGGENATEDRGNNSSVNQVFGQNQRQMSWERRQYFGGQLQTRGSVAR